MQTIAVWLAAILPGMVSRVLLALGIGVATTAGFQIAWDSVKGSILSSIGGIPGDILGLAGLAGVGEGVGIILGAITARVAFMTIQQSLKFVGKTA